MKRDTPLFQQNPAARLRLASFRRVVLAALIALNLAAAGLVILSIRDARQAAIEAARTSTVNLATAVERDIAGLMARIDLALLNVGDEVSKQFASSPAKTAAINAFMARQAARIPEATALRFAAADGRMLYGSSADPRINIADREHFIRARESTDDRLIVGKPVLARLGKKWVLPVAKRIDGKDGDFAGIVYALVSLDRLATVFSHMDVGRHGGIALRDAEMGLIVRVPELEGVGAQIGNRSISQTAKNLAATGEHVATYTATTPADGRTRTISLHKVDAQPLYVAVSLAEEEYLAAWREQAGRTAALLFAILLLSLLSGWMMARMWRRGLLEVDALAESRQLFQTVTEHAHDWVYWRSTDGTTFHYLSSACEAITGYARADFEADPGLLDRIVHPEDRARWDAHLRDKPDNFCHANEEFRIVTRQGEVRWMNHGCREVVAPDGTRLGRRGTNQDITAQKLSAEILRRQLASLKALNAVASIRSASFGNTMHQALDVGARFLGLEFGIISQVRNDIYTVVAQISPPQTLHDGQTFPLGITYCAMTLAQDGVLAIHDMGRSSLVGHPCYEAFKLETYIGAPVIVAGEVYGTVNFSSPRPYHRAFDEGDREFIVLMARWVGAAIEREQGRRRLADSEARMRALIDASDESTLLLDPAGKLLAINLAGAKRFGKTPERMIGVSFFDCLPPDLAAARRTTLQLAVETGDPLRTIDQRGLVSFENNIYPVKNDAGLVESIAVYAKDISARRRDEQTEALFHRVDTMLLKWQMNAPTIAQMFCEGLLPLFDLTTAWVGHAEKNGELSLLAVAARENGNVDFAALVHRKCRRWRDGECQCTPAKLAMASGQAQVFDIAGGACATCSDAGRDAGIATTMSIPLTLRGEIWGVLALYAEQASLFDAPETSSRLTSIASRFATSLEATLQQEWLVLLETALATASNAAFITDAAGRILWVNRAFTVLSGFADSKLVDATPKLFKSGVQDEEFYRRFWATLQAGETWQGEVVNARQDGSRYTVNQTVTPLRNAGGDIGHYVSILEDITARKTAEARIEHMANFDMLTELPNRNLFFDRLGQALAFSRRDGHMGALLFLDLDRFKEVNDSLGHEAGDLLLKAVAARCLESVRASDTVARLAGDEFTVLLPRIAGADDAARVAEKIVAAIGRPFDLGDRAVGIGVSIGIALYPRHGDNIEAILNAADSAMYEAKRAGRHTYRFFPPQAA